MFDKQMTDALKADGEKLRALTGEDHGPEFPDACGYHGDDLPPDEAEALEELFLRREAEAAAQLWEVEANPVF
jgi:hypothetical protein